MKIIYLILFIIFSSNVLSEDYINEFSDLKEGAILKPLTDEDYDLRLYIFVDMNSCFVCQGMIPDLEKILNQPDLKLEKNIFFSGASKKSATEYVNEKDWDYNLIVDYNNIYTDYYKIKMLPAYLILDKDGKLLFVDKLGGIRSTKSKLDSVIAYARANKPNKKDDRILSSIEILNDDNENIYTSHIRTIEYLEQTDEYLFNSDYDDIIYRVNNKGRIIDKIELDEILSTIDNSAENLIDFVYKEESQDLVMVMNTRGIFHHIMRYNLKDKKIYLGSVEYIRTTMPGFRAGLDIDYSVEENLVFLRLDSKTFYSKPTKKEESQLFVFDLKDSVATLKSTIKYEPTIRKNNDIWGFNDALPKVYENRLFITNMHSTDVFEFDTEGNFEKKYGIYNSKYYRYKPNPMVSTDRNEYMYFRGRASINEVLLYDKTKNKIYIHFQNMDKVDSTNVKLGRRVPNKFYLVEVSDDPNSSCVEYELPEDNVPFYIDNGIVHTSTNGDGLKIHRIKIE